MITLDGSRLTVRFAEVHTDAVAAIEFQRTLRIPDDGRTYPLPPGLGSFPLRMVDSLEGRVPEDWARRGGVVMPMHQAEAMWVSFPYHWGTGYPFAIKVATGRINAVTGDEWTDGLHDDPQDYLVVPTQPWLDGYCVEKGSIRQFVAMPLGKGYTAEEQLTGRADTGGLQLIAYPMKPERYETIKHRQRQRSLGTVDAMMPMAAAAPMGLAPGGRMKQHIYDDPYGLDAWDQTQAARCFVAIVNSLGWLELTGSPPPWRPPSAKEYTAHGLPWFDFYADDRPALEGADKLAKLKSVAEMGEEKGEMPLPENEPVDPKVVIALGPGGRPIVREGEW